MTPLPNPRVPALEDAQNPLYLRDHLGEAGFGEKQGVLVRPTLAESYAKGELTLHLHLGGRWGNAKVANYCIGFEFSDGKALVVHDRRVWGEAKGDLRGRESRAASEQDVVLVRDVMVVKKPRGSPKGLARR